MLCSYYKELINFENPDSKKFICAQTRANCRCGGEVDNCDFYHSKEDEKKETGFIYYAHHQWKYDTKIEAYELALIERYFPYAAVIWEDGTKTSVFCNYENKRDRYIGFCTAVSKKLFNRHEKIKKTIDYYIC